MAPNKIEAPKKTIGSRKTAVIEILFRDQTRWDQNGNLIRPVVTFSDLNTAIQARNRAYPQDKPLKIDNPANFFKDFGRKSKSAEKNWPAYVLEAGYTGVAEIGGGSSFKFSKLQKGQTTAFAVTADVYPKNPATAKLSVVQTLSVEIMNKALARKDENWLQSMAVMLHIPHTHLALHPLITHPFVQVGHMQSNLKLRKTEIDGLYFGYLDDGRVVLITMEVKGSSDDILESQVLEQIAAVQEMPKVKDLLSILKVAEADTTILPMAMKLVDSGCATDVPGLDSFGLTGKRLLYMIDYGPVPFKGKKPASLTPCGETLFDLRPPIKGINT